MDGQIASLTFIPEIKKVKKIKYTLNILPSIQENSSNTLVNALGKTDELSIFNSKVLFDLLEFKWQAYAGTIHKVSLLSHCCYVITFTIFINHVYVDMNKDISNTLFITMLSCLLYPCIYDMT